MVFGVDTAPHGVENLKSGHDICGLTFVKPAALINSGSRKVQQLRSPPTYYTVPNINHEAVAYSTWNTIYNLRLAQPKKGGKKKKKKAREAR